MIVTVARSERFWKRRVGWGSVFQILGGNLESMYHVVWFFESVYDKILHHVGCILQAISREWKIGHLWSKKTSPELCNNTESIQELEEVLWIINNCPYQDIFPVPSPLLHVYQSNFCQNSIPWFLIGLILQNKINTYRCEAWILIQSTR